MELIHQNMDMIIKLVAAALLGGLIGFERDLHHKIAGSRTYSLVSVGSALIMLVSIEIFKIYHGQASVDPGRIAAQVVTGIGFLGAGTIIRYQEGVKGLTTAAGIWVACGIGLACGLGFYFAAIITTLIVILILEIFSRIGRAIGARDV